MLALLARDLRLLYVHGSPILTQRLLRAGARPVHSKRRQTTCGLRSGSGLGLGLGCLGLEANGHSRASYRRSSWATKWMHFIFRP